jgi:anaerobic selenocysteine-containing dehydrogenase
MCGLAIEHDGEKVLSIRGDAEDSFSEGHICPKAVALQDIQQDPDRLRRPMRRNGDKWEAISWEAAFEVAEREIKRVRERHGSNSIAVYLGNPTVHSTGALLYAPLLLRALKTRNRYSATSVDQLPHHVAAATMFGHAMMIPIADLDRTDYLLILGANPAASKGSLLTAGDVMARIGRIKERGGRVVVVDPRRTETAAAADAHHFIRPGTDALLLCAMLHVVFRDGLARLGRLDAHMNGVAELRALVERFSPERVAEATGMPADTIVALAREFAGARRAVAYGRIGISLQAHGALACWLTTALNIVTGRLDAEGGAMFTNPAVEVIRASKVAGFSGAKFGRWKSRVRGLPEFGGEFPVATLADEIETPGDGQVRALITHAGNPVLSTPNGARLDRAIAGLEFYLAIDFYVNETTRHAHLILPPTGPLEREHYDLAFHALAVRNTAKWSPPMIERTADARHDWEILNELTWRLAPGNALAQLQVRARSRALEALGPRGLIDIALRAGPHGPKLFPPRAGLSVKALEAAPHGIDLGPLEPCLPEKLRTKDKRIDLAPEKLVADAARLDALVGSGAKNAGEKKLVLVGRRDLRSNNSWMHNHERLMRGRSRCTLYVHPDDARTRGVAAGTRVRVKSKTGTVDVEVEVTDAVMPGVVCLPHGWGHDRSGTQLSVASTKAGASLNDLTDEGRIDPLCGNAAFNGTEVEIEPLA